MAHSTTSLSSVSRRFLDSFITFLDLPQPPPPYIKGVFPLTKASFRTFNSPHEWLSAILDNESTQMNRCFVEQVVHYKRTDRKEHEFILLQVGLVNSPQKGCIIVERTAQTQNEADKSASQSKSSPLPSHDLPTFNNVITCAYLNSEGYYALARHWRLHACKPVRKLTFDVYATRPSILELATLVQVTSSRAPPYSMFRDQWYWFATIIVESVMMLFPIALRTVEPPRWSWTHQRMDAPTANEVSHMCDAYHRELRVVRNRIAEAEGRWEEARWQQTIERMRQEARDGARAEGHAEGVKEGHAEGIEQGRAEERATLERERAALDAREKELAERMEALKAMESRVQIQASD